MIEMRNIVFGYNENKLFENFSLTINADEKVVIIGKSGTGKSTLLMMLGNIVKVSSGEIRLFNEDVSTFKKSSIVFQNGALFPWKSVRQNLDLALSNSDLSKEQKSEKILKIAYELEIELLLERFIKELSGGQAQRVAIGRALVNDSKLLLLDEPSSSLDAITKEKFQESLLKIYRNHTLTSILITHDIEEAVYLGKKIIVLGHGEIIKVIDNELYDLPNIRNSVQFYEKCIELRELLKL